MAGSKRYTTTGIPLFYWEDDRSRQDGIFKVEKDQESRKLFCGEHILTVASAGGCSKLKKGLEKALNRNRFASQFRERQNILKGIEWEKYTVLQEAFRLLAVLS